VAANGDFVGFSVGLKALGWDFVRRERLFWPKTRIASLSREFLDRLEL
jgi:hypothetical protein